MRSLTYSTSPPDVARAPRPWSRRYSGMLHARGARATTHRAGFTLVEVLATLVLIGIVLPVAMKGISLAASAGGMARRSIEASALAETKLNELVATGQWNAVTQSGDFGEDWPGYRWIAQANERDASLMEMSVQVLWTSRNSERSVSVSTLVFTGSSTSSMTGL